MTEPVRVAQVVGKMVGGGVEAVVMNYYRHINRGKVQFDFLVDSDSTLVPRDEIESLGGRVFEIPPYQHVAEYQRELQRLFKQEGWKIVHSHINALSVFPLRAAKKAGVPVRIAHSHSTSGRGEYAKNALKAVLKTQSNRYPTHRFACSKFAGEWLFGSSSQFVVMRNAVDLSVFAPDDEDRLRTRRSLGVADGQLLIGHIGRFTEQKNHSYLLNIFDQVLKIRNDAVLVLVGSGPLVEQIKDQADCLGISHSVRFLGTRSDAASLYRAFDVFCLPSLYEGLPMVGVECQASHTPILASDTVTSETAVTSMMQFESLSSSCIKWAERLIELSTEVFAPGDDAGLQVFEINAAARVLLDCYMTYLGSVD